MTMKLSKGSASIEILIALLIMALVVFSLLTFGPKIWSAAKALLGLGDATRYTTEDNKNIKTDDEKTKTAISDFVLFSEFLRTLKSQTYSIPCRISFKFDSGSNPKNYNFYLSNDGKFLLVDSSSKTTIKSESYEFIPYYALADSLSYESAFKNLDLLKQNLYIYPYGTKSQVKVSSSISVVESDTMFAVAKGNKWILTQPFDFVRNLPECYT